MPGVFWQRSLQGAFGHWGRDRRATSSCTCGLFWGPRYPRLGWQYPTTCCCPCVSPARAKGSSSASLTADLGLATDGKRVTLAVSQNQRELQKYCMISTKEKKKKERERALLLAGVSPGLQPVPHGHGCCPCTQAPERSGDVSDCKCLCYN